MPAAATFSFRYCRRFIPGMERGMGTWPAAMRGTAAPACVRFGAKPVSTARPIVDCGPWHRFEARNAPAKILVGQIGHRFHGTGQISPTQRAVGDQRDVQFPAAGQERLFHIPMPQAVLGLQCSNRVNLVGLSSVSADTSDRPIYRTLPETTKSAIAPTVSSMGTSDPFGADSTDQLFLFPDAADFFHRP